MMLIGQRSMLSDILTACLILLGKMVMMAVSRYNSRNSCMKPIMRLLFHTTKVLHTHPHIYTNITHNGLDIMGFDIYRSAFLKHLPKRLYFFGLFIVFRGHETAFYNAVSVVFVVEIMSPNFLCRGCGSQWLPLCGATVYSRFCRGRQWCVLPLLCGRRHVPTG